MATADELLATTSETMEEILVADLVNRTIVIPATLRILGVESDDDVRRLYFNVPRYYGKIDLSEFKIQVNFENAKGDGDVWPVDDLVVNQDDILTFSWLVDRSAFKYAGNVTFNLCMKKYDTEGIVVKELNTTTVSLPVLKGLETSKELVENNPSAFDAVLFRLYAVEEDVKKINENGASNIDLTDYVKSVNGVRPDETGNVQITVPDSGGNVDLTGYATEQYVKDYAQPEGDYALRSEIPSVPVKSVNGKTGAVSLTATDVKARPDSWMPTASDVGALPSSTVIPTVPTKVSEFTNDAGYLTEHQDLSEYAKKTEIPSVPVKSVNGKTGAVSLTASDVKARPDTWMPSASDVGALPSSTVIPTVPTKLSAFTNDSGFITGYTETDPTVPAWAKQSTKPSYSKSEVGLGNVDNVKQYSASNPPPYPVTSVNGKTGAVSLTIPTVPTKVSAFDNDAGYLTKHQDISGKVDKQGLTLGIYTDGLIYVFVDGVPVGNGVELPTGGIDGYVDSDKNIVVRGLSDGTYTFHFEMSDGSLSDGYTLVKDSNVYYTVKNTLTNCTSNNSATQAIGGQSYSATITAKSGYELKSVTVTMGGSPVTVSGGKIAISNVTGNIVITAVAEEKVVEIVNQLPISTDESGDLYTGTNGEKGYKSGYRIKMSSASESVASGAYCTGFIPVVYNDTIYIKGITLHSTVDYNAICFYKSDHTYITSAATNFTNTQISLDGDVYSVPVHKNLLNAVTSDSGVAFVRFSCGGISNETVVTVNEEIS